MAIDLIKMSNEIMRSAEQNGVEHNFFFLTTFRRYQVQLKTLIELESEIKKEGTMVTKEYVKGRKNLYTNPAIQEFNKTADAANRTVATLLKIIKDLRKTKNEDEEEDPLLKALRGEVVD